MGKRKSYHQRLIEEGYEIIRISDHRRKPIADLAETIGRLDESTSSLHHAESVRIVPAEIAFHHETWTIEPEKRVHVLYAHSSYVIPEERMKYIEVTDRNTGETYHKRIGN